MGFRWLYLRWEKKRDGVRLSATRGFALDHTPDGLDAAMAQTYAECCAILLHSDERAKRRQAATRARLYGHMVFLAKEYDAAAKAALCV